VSIIKATYTNTISKIFGNIASKKFHPFCQKQINRLYIKITGVDLNEFESIESYKTLNELFTRKLKKMRDFSTDVQDIISPADSLISEANVLDKNSAMQIKGFNYSIDELLTDYISKVNREKLYDSKYINFYLSPKDYHRYHMPFDVKVLSLTYIPGKLYPVNMPLLKGKKNLYLENERVVLEVVDRFNNKHFIVLVGALNVGKMVVTFEQEVKTNAKESKRFTIEYSEPKELKKGELFGWFEMGSTIVMLSQKDAIEWSVDINQKVSFAQVLGELKGEY